MPAETAISAGLPINQDDSATKIARQLQDHRHIVLLAAYLSAVYAVAFVIYPDKLHDLLRRVSAPPGRLHSLVLIGGVLLAALHGVSDIGIYGLVLDLSGFVLFLVFVLLSSAILPRDRGPAHSM